MTLRVASLGAGYFAQFQLEAWSRMARVDLVGIFDLDHVKAELAAAKYDAEAYASLDALLDATRPDILDIAVPPDGHAHAITAGIDAGIGTIICQKPFCASLDQARQMTKDAKAAGARLVIHENFRWQPWYRVMREAILQGRIGPPQNLTFRLRTGDGQGPQAYLDRQPYFQTMPRLLIHETGVHWIDVFRFLMGAEPTAVYADLRKLNPVIAGEDAGHMILDFETGARALFDGNRLLDHNAAHPRLTLGEACIEGSDGTLSLSGDGAVTFRAFGSRNAEWLLPAYDWQGFGGDCVYQLQLHVVAALLDDGPLENLADDYLSVRKTEIAAYRSAETGSKIALT
ncbi:MAG: Gfo/Idh/MocA family oxidoreductase [Pseudomonadota bacterium]